ncbi:SMC family ATPase [Candidatus Dependentiae bacterium]|nr:SMC family ATPase [Candidatus Dependentiae bacterium]
MIPHVLHIKNFLSYGPETQIIDFRPYNLISLSGKNGHGKSALLDAITWGIWGQARKSSGQAKPDAGLMHLGQKHMMIILEFEVNGNLYRVRREYLQTQSKAFATLDFGIQSKDGKLIALTDKTIKDTQDKIDRTIGITYESFVNSTFLRQGQSNEFSKKSPKERKEILAQILQLQRFENQKKIALAHTRKLQQEYQTNLQIEQRISQEISDLATVQEQYLTTQEKINANISFNKDLQKEISFLQKESQILLSQENEQRFILKQKTIFKEKHDEICKQISSTQQNLSTITNSLPIQELKTTQEKITKEIFQNQQYLQERLILRENYLTTKEQLQHKLNSIQQEFDKKLQEHSINTNKNEEIIKHAMIQKQEEKSKLLQIKIELAAAIAKNNEFLEFIKKYDQSSEMWQQEKIIYDQKRQEHQNICTQGTYLKQHIQKLEKDIRHLESNENNNCLSCLQKLDYATKELLIKSLQNELQTIQQQLESFKMIILELKSILIEKQSVTQKYQQEHELFVENKARQEQQQLIINQLMNQKKSFEEKILDLEAIHNTTQLTNENLKRDFEIIRHNHQQRFEYDEIKVFNKDLIEIENKAKALPILSNENHQKLEQELKKITEQIEQEKSPDQMIELQTILGQFIQQKLTIEKQLLDIDEQIKEYANLAEKIQNIQEQEKKIINTLDLNQQEYQKMLIEKGSLEQKQKKQIALLSEHSAIQLSIKNLQQEFSDYQEICKALGKDGIQALLIEQAIPEIEHETNQILSRLTHNQTQIFIESLKDLKKGGCKETLDIKIADSFGIRDYEMFSGGEAFRIDFALRIGISKLLARRAGTTLQTIFIDEGFGSQDEEGLGLIMDNIYKIQEEFAKIIVVSHLPEMKEQFPVQFIVEKKRSGSTISIQEQG